MGASSWLAGRAQGGMTREVLSHWIYLVERLLGHTELEAAAVRYPPGGKLAETHVLAQLSASGVPVCVACSVGGRGPDQVECTFWGSAQSCRIRDWSRLAISSGEAWVDAGAADDRRQQSQLDQAAAALAGEPHGLPSFRDALSVQERIEAILARGARERA
jgi:predicted dehydrogenase